MALLKLTIDNSICKLEGLNAKQHKELSDLMSYQIDAQAAYFSGAYNRKRTLMGKRGDFPTGLLYIAEAYLKNATHQINDLRTRPNYDFPSLNVEISPKPYREQIEAAMEATSHSRGMICAPTGVGKTLIVALIIKLLRVKTLVVVPTLELKRQLSETLLGIFKSLEHIDIQNVDAFDPTVETKHDCVIIDEFHHSGAKTYRKLNKKAWKNVYYKFGLTATPFRSNDNERLLLESVLSKVIYRISYKQAIDKGYIVPLEAYYVDLPKTKTNGYTWHEVYGDLVVKNVKRNKILHEILVNLQASKAPTLCLVKEINHGQYLNCSTGIQFANGQTAGSTKLIQEFAEGRRNSLIATIGVCGEGVDTKAAEYVVIASLGKSKNQFMQMVGRVMRNYQDKLSGKVILFRDASHKWTLQHFKAQVKYLKEEYGIKPVKLEI